jgi:hypothetical protein
MNGTLRKIILFFKRYNTHTLFLSLGFLFLVFVTYLKYPDFLNVRLMQDRFFVCFEYIAQGVLYNGQPYCAQGPVLLYSLYGIYRLFGEHLYLAISFVGVLLNLGILFLMRLIIEKETKQKVFLSLLIVYTFVLYFPIMSSLYGMLLSTFFFLLGFYVFQYSSSKVSYGLAGFFFSLALFSKFTVFIPLLLFLAFILGKKLIVSFRSAPSLLSALRLSFVSSQSYFGPFLAGLFVPFFVLFFIFPSILSYSAFSHSINPSSNYGSAFFGILSQFNFLPLFSSSLPFYTFFSFIFIILFSVSFFVFFLRRDVFSFLASFATLFSLLKFFQVNGGATIIEYYFALHYVFFIFVFYFLFFKIRFTSLSPKRVCFIVLLLVFLLLIPFFLHFFQEVQMQKARSVSEGGLEFLSSLELPFLFENIPSAIAFQKFLPEFSYVSKNVTIVREDYFDWDSHYSPRLVQLGVSSVPPDFLEERWISDSSLTALSEGLVEGKFGTLVLTSLGERNIHKSLREAELFLTENPCVVHVPLFIEHDYYFLGTNRHKIIAVFLNNRDVCAQYQLFLLDYYTDHYEDLCSLGVDLAEEAKHFLLLNAENTPLVLEDDFGKKQLTLDIVSSLHCQNDGFFSYSLREKLAMRWAN